MPLPKLEDVLAGAVGLNDRELGYNTRFVYPRLGIGAARRGHRARARAGAPIELARAPTSIDRRRGEAQFDDEVVPYDVLISTAPLPLLDRAHRRRASGGRRGRRGACAARTSTTSTSRSTRPCEEPLHWVYVPEEKYPFYRVGCYSNFSGAMAPPGKANLYVELADRAEPDLADALAARRATGSSRWASSTRRRDPLRARAAHRPRVRGLRSRLLRGARGDPAVPRAEPHRLGGPLRRLELLLDGGRAPLRPRRAATDARCSERVGDVSDAARDLDRHPRLQRGGDPARGGRRPARAAARRSAGRYEIILAENGSRDRTRRHRGRARREVPRGPLLLARRAELRRRPAPGHRARARGEFVHLRRDRPLRHRLPPRARSSMLDGGRASTW